MSLSPEEILIGRVLFSAISTERSKDEGAVDEYPGRFVFGVYLPSVIIFFSRADLVPPLNMGIFRPAQYRQNYKYYFLNYDR